ncbi:hypothetical protein BH11MYX1_BH11MYX1_50170 [soil metagenome]
MRTTRWLVLSLVVSLAAACGTTDNNNTIKKQCNDGIDNDGDGFVDFPDDPGCISETDDTENSLPSPQCADGRDNDGDGKVDFPNDPGCFAPQQDSETDDCPTGPSCPQCSNGKDDDNNGVTDFPNDPGCTSAADSDEFTDNPAACGSNVVVQQVPLDGHIMGTLNMGAASSLISPTCGGGGAEDVYELRINSPKVVVATTDRTGTVADTVLYVRSADCINNSSEMSCNDDAMNATVTGASTLTVNIPTPGVYYLIVDAHDSGAGGAYDLQVDFLTGEGELCDAPATCGPGLVCRVPLGMTQKVCSQHVCNDGVDDDGDGKNDYPNDPGCTSADDDDETDTCPGVGCPECADGVDNDGDTKTDYPNDTSCSSASGASESCPSTDGVDLIVAATTSGTTTGAHNDVTPACGSTTTYMAPDKTYRLDIPALSSLTITTTPSFDALTTLYGATCGGTPIGGTSVGCQDTSNIVEANLAAGSYYIVVDGYFTDAVGAFTFTVAGKIAANGKCEGTLATAGALTCSTGYACAGTVGTKTCQPAACNDGVDNDGDGKIDYPFDPGCDSASDNTEANPTALPVCGNTTDDDTDGTNDYPADYGCSSAAGTSEVFCIGEHDPTALITAKVTTGTTAGKANDLVPSCSTGSTAPDVVYALQLPVAVQALQIDTIGSAFDTVVSVRDPQCTTTVLCADDGTGTVGPSKLSLTNMTAGGYSVIVDGYSANNGAFTLNVNGTVGAGTACTAAAFTGANAWLKCATGLTCTAGKCM